MYLLSVRLCPNRKNTIQRLVFLPQCIVLIFSFAQNKFKSNLSKSAHEPGVEPLSGTLRKPVSLLALLKKRLQTTAIALFNFEIGAALFGSTV